MLYNVELEEFSGPLDLLLHLIKESKMEIKDVNLVDITNQYLDYINKQEELNLNVASEYLVLASELLEIKSKILLPPKEKDEDEDEEDPKERLIQKLIDYEQYKKMTSTFKELETIRGEIYTKTPESLRKYVDDTTVITSDVTMDDLMNAFQKFLERKAFSKPLETKVTAKGVTVEERRMSIKNILREKKKVDFVELFDVFSKEYIVVTFLAILEMARKSELLITQEKNFDKITVEVVS